MYLVCTPLGRFGLGWPAQCDSAEQQYHTAAVVQVPGIFAAAWYASYIGTAVIVNIAIAVASYREGEKSTGALGN